MAEKSEKIINLIEASANAIKEVLPRVRELLKDDDSCIKIEEDTSVPSDSE